MSGSSPIRDNALMNRARVPVLGVFAAALLAPWCQPGAAWPAQHGDHDPMNCFLVVAGKDCTTDGSVVVAHNEDSGADRPVHFWRVEAAAHEERDRQLVRGGSVPFSPHTHGYIWCQMPGLEFSDTYFNEHGVAIVSNGCSSREDQPDLTDGGIAFMLRRIIAARASTARQGVEVAASLLARFGYADTGRCLVIADADEAWLVNIVRGKHWAAARVPDDKCAVVANHYTIHQVDPADPANFNLSPGLIDHARQRGWYDPARDGEFDFATVYGSDGARQHPSNIRRAWRANDMLSPGATEEHWLQPTFVTPDQELGVTDLMAVLRDHCEGTKYDSSENYTKCSPHQMGIPTICARNTSFSTVFQLRADMPAAIGAVMWIAMCRPDASVYVPWYAGIRSIPPSYATGDAKTAVRDHFEPAFVEQEPPANFAAVRAFEKRLEPVYGRFFARLAEARDRFEAEVIRANPQIEATARQLHGRDSAMARAYLTAYSHGRQIRAARLISEWTAMLPRSSTATGQNGR